ncbi:MAG: DUF885 family protein [Deltaproteobacteria bacterium]|nr:DUF885 family protein [Deltaproteobacteria bacterium]MBT7713304.1 DUF885 family protein [Deltaproteobacteria bacterium]MBT7889742.1 DUF885 family protein [Deltaproteobacteria bacterium]
MTLEANSHFRIAERYFDYLAWRFPVMCASDEFHFLPRAEKAGDFYHRLDNLDQEAITESVEFLKKLQRELRVLEPEIISQETLFDLKLLKANLNGVLIELEQNRSWSYNPLLYLKIAFIGLDHALHKPSASQAERTERFNARLHSIPGLFQQAILNISSIPTSYHNASLCMIVDCEAYLNEFTLIPDIGANTVFGNSRQKVLESLSQLLAFIRSVSPIPDQQFGTDTLSHSLENHFVIRRKPDEIFEIAVNDWQENVKELEKLSQKIDGSRNWQKIYHTYRPPAATQDTLQLYEQETSYLERFFRENGLDETGLSSPVKMQETPTYLRSVRGTASFAAAFSSDKREMSYFYITTSLPGENRTRETALLGERFHREFQFLTAHETVPGHHYLDTIRRHLTNPIRRQIESPLFYEGWASYAESLLPEYGYVDRPLDFLIDHKRRLWRAARCQVDIGLPFGFLKKAEALDLLISTGFSREEALRQIYRFQLNPGYQVCYCLGRYEIETLKKSFAGRLGREQFHSAILEGGELPFQLLREKLKRICE